jgi:hypothetical protein
MIFNTNNESGVKAANAELKKLLGKVVEIKRVKQTRSSQQNRALHLFFNQVAKELNEIGIPFVYRGLKGQDMEMQWTGLLFKEMTWKPIQKSLYGTESTTKLKRNEIDPIFEIINKFFAEKGITISFPNQFELYLKFYDENIK